jgi:hypothetical protein
MILMGATFQLYSLRPDYQFFTFDSLCDHNLKVVRHYRFITELCKRFIVSFSEIG